MEKNFNLIYHCKKTGKVFLVKRLFMHSYMMLDPETGETRKISRYMLSKGFRSDKDNHKRVKKIRPGRLLNKSA